ncbi:MAG: cobalamin B12-binding domain-containing protein [Melioribacter sp.]|nr:cobalamin B12-binding domain-containing protein [Melioribacter sp.]
MKKAKIILGCALGNCVHIGGLNHFLKLAELEGYETYSLGPAVSIERLFSEIEKLKPDLVAVSYRLTPEVASNLFDLLKATANNKSIGDTKFIFGGTPSVAKVAREKNFFERVFDGTENINEIKAYLKGRVEKSIDKIFPQTLIERIEQKYPYPILRHHFGRPSLKETIEGIRKISEAQVLDVISLGTDQNAQEFFFTPELMKPELDGAGGVPVRRKEDLIALYEASRCGNYPLMRCYSGTNDLIKWAEMSLETINNAWAAIPLTWYSVLDGRSKRPLEISIKENQLAMKWYAEHNVPVEVNESHQWSLRDAHDSLAVAMAFLAAYNAKKMGVKNYVSQFMFNTPPGTSPQMDIAKMVAKNELIEELKDENFNVYREVRAGIAHFSPNPEIAKGQLASSTFISLALKPHILHVVAYCEGDHAVYPEELIESCNIVHGVIQNCLFGYPDVEKDEVIVKRKDELKREAKDLLMAIKIFGKDKSDDPWSDANVLASAIKVGILDTPHFWGNPLLCGNIKTNLINGAWYAIDEQGNILRERDRLKEFLN